MLDLVSRRKRLRFRAWHRGMRETDILLGTFCDGIIERLKEEEIAEFEHLLDVPDRDLMAWVMGENSPPPEHDTDFLRKLIAFHTHAHPKYL